MQDSSAFHSLLIDHCNLTTPSFVTIETFSPCRQRCIRYAIPFGPPFVNGEGGQSAFFETCGYT